MTTALIDGEFSHIHGDMVELNVFLNTMSRDKHVRDIEQCIRTMKERIRAVYNTLAFLKIPSHIVIEMAKYAIFWLNAIPSINSISNLSPCTIITGQQIDYNCHCHIHFMQYTQTHKEHDNLMHHRMIGVFALHPASNAKGSLFSSVWRQDVS